MRQFILLPTFEKGLWSSIYLQLEASCDVYKKYWDFYLSNVSFTCIFGFRLQKLLKSLNFLLLLMECMDTLLLVVTHLFQWDLLAIVPVLTLGTLSKRWMVPWLACEKWSLWALACLEIPRLTPLLLICVVHWHSFSAVLLLYASCIDVSFSNRLLSALTEHKNVSFSFQKAELQPNFLYGRNHLLILFSLSIMFLVC